VSQQVYDYSEDVEDRRGDNAMAVLQGLVLEARDAQREVEEAEQALKEAQSRFRDITEVRFPEAMDNAGQLDCRVTDGTRCVLSEVIRASIPKDRTHEALSWLRANGQASVIKNILSVALGRGEDEKAAFIRTQLKGFEVEQKQTVHPQTLQALIKELLAEGVDIPLDTFGAIKQRKVVLK
jgi:Arc/MetJ-type ribon-helix-helix transcriptional regulator